MNDIFHISKLIIKKKLKVATPHEIQELKRYDTENSKPNSLKFKRLASRLEDYGNIDLETAWQAIEQKLTEKRTVKLVPLYKKPWFQYTAAAIVIGLMVGITFINKNPDQSIVRDNTPIIVNNNIKTGSDKATLTLEDGTKITLEKGTAYQTQNATSNGKEIVYLSSRAQSRDQQTTNNQQPTTNTLTIPRGGQFQITLSDGTKVWLNSETQIKYPVSFTDGQSRQVELVYGEAYFEVTHSTEHKGSNFKVVNNNQEVEVLGTKFNIKAYKDEKMVYTTLVEGKVSVTVDPTSYNQQPTTKILAPNQQSTVDINNKNIEVANITVRGEVAWVNGEFILQRKNLKEIMKVLSRWYDMEVIFSDRSLEDVRFVGILRKNQDIVEVLDIIKGFGVINDYEINNKKVIIK